MYIHRKEGNPVPEHDDPNVASAVQRLFESLGVEIVNERVLSFILQEIHDGKSLTEAMAEPYVLNNSTETWRREILERPELIKAVEEEVQKRFQVNEGE